MERLAEKTITASVAAASKDMAIEEIDAALAKQDAPQWLRDAVMNAIEALPMAPNGKLVRAIAKLIIDAELSNVVIEVDYTRAG